MAENINSVSFGKDKLTTRQFKEAVNCDKILFTYSPAFKQVGGKWVKEGHQFFRNVDGTNSTTPKVDICNEANVKVAELSRRIAEEMLEGEKAGATKMEAFLSAPVVFQEVTSTYPGKGEREGQTITKTVWRAMRPQEVERFAEGEL